MNYSQRTSAPKREFSKVFHYYLRLRDNAAIASATSPNTNPPAPRYIAVSTVSDCCILVVEVVASGEPAITEETAEAPEIGTETEESRRFSDALVSVPFTTWIPKYSL